MTAKIEKTAAILHDARARGRAAVGRRAGAGRRERVSAKARRRAGAGRRARGQGREGEGQAERDREIGEMVGETYWPASPGTPTSPLCGSCRGGASGARPTGRALNMSRGRNPLGRSTHSIDSSPGARACCCLRSAMTRLHAAASRSLRARFAVVLARFARAEGSPAVARHMALSGLSPSLSPLESLAPHPLQCSRRLARPETL